MYLTLDAITATLATIAQSLPGTQLGLTYNQPHYALDSFAVAVASTLTEIAREIGEPFASLFLPTEIKELLRKQNFGDIVDFGRRRLGPSTSTDVPMLLAPERNGW
jgi:hypothetical protein